MAYMWPALLSRALGLKKIDDLTDLIRELVLEPSGVRDDARKVVAEFADLVAIHGQLLDARRQETHLARLPELNATIDKAEAEIQSLSEEKQGLPVYFGEHNNSIHFTTVVRCRFDGTTLTYVEHGDELVIDFGRGYSEPSLVQFKGRFYLTLRNDRRWQPVGFRRF